MRALGRQAGVAGLENQGFALLSFLGFIAFLFIDAIKTFNKKENYLLVGVLSGIFAFLVHSFFDTGLYSLSLEVLFWFMAGYGLLFSVGIYSVFTYKAIRKNRTHSHEEGMYSKF
ncbi:MAG: hypothetical protein AAB316_07420 [Bacteroidota bacterium]